jgi:YHS domain-containing protein
MFRPIHFYASSRCLPAAILLATLASTAQAEIHWHADLPAAVAAATSSGKPILAIFDASWGDTDSNVLSSAEVEAVVSACFEPVRLDVDTHRTLASQLGVEHVPSACVLDRNELPLAAFECPQTASEFVAAAARAAQVAATPRAPAGDAEIAADAAASNAFAARSSAADKVATAVSDKVRQLSSFADGSPSKPRLIAADDEETASLLADRPAYSAYSTPPAAPSLATTPSHWQAEQPMSFAAVQANEPVTAQATTTYQPTSAEATRGETTRTAIEPQPSQTAPWLAASQAPAEAPPSEPAASVPSDAEASEPPASKPSVGFFAALQNPWGIFSGSSSKAAIQPPAPPPTMPPARPQWPAALTGMVKATPAPTPPDTHGPMPLGLEGYCPVTVVERGSWVEGRPQWGARHRGRTYLFAGPEQQQAFLADPDRYAPALSGDDPVLAFENSRSQPGRRAYGVSYQSRMYLFSSPETRAAFTADPDRYMARVAIAEGLAPSDGTRRF